MVACKVAGTAGVFDVPTQQVCARNPLQYTTFRQVADHLLGEEWVPGSPFGHPFRHPADRRVIAQQFGGQGRRLRIVQRSQRHRLRVRHLGQLTPVLGAVGGQHQRRGLRNHGQELGQHGLADLIDPVHVLDDVDGGISLFQRGRVHQRRQPAAPRIGGDIGHGHGRVPNSQ